MFNYFTLEGEILLKPVDDTYFEVAEDFTVKCYTERSGVLTVKVKAGLLTDLGSVPKWVQSLTGIHSRGNMFMTAAFIIHDFLYSTQSHLHDFTFDFVNDLLSDQMEHTQVGIGSIKQYLVYTAVDLGGRNAWETFDEQDYENIESQVKPKWGLR